jgi:geranylgeranyl pyrophosphate synthase
MKLVEAFPTGSPTPSGQFNISMIERAALRRSKPSAQTLADSWRQADESLAQVTSAMLNAAQAPGILGEAAKYQLSGTAKRLRARMALALGHAFQTDLNTVVKIAAACELLHEASLVHDDLQDQDTMRRGRKAVWVAYSPELAITLGDWFINQAYDVILSVDVSATTTRQLARSLAKAVGDTVRGQAIENEAKTNLNATTSDYIDMAAGKTAPLLAFPLEAVCAVAGRSQRECAAIRSGLECLGGAYQLRDDLIDLLGDKGRGDGGADLVEGKATLPVVVYYRDGSPEQRQGLECFLKKPREEREKQVAFWVQEILFSHAFDEVRDTVDGLMDMGFRYLNDSPVEVSMLCKRLFGKLIGPVERPATSEQRVKKIAAV